MSDELVEEKYTLSRKTTGKVTKIEFELRKY